MTPTPPAVNVPLQRYSLQEQYHDRMFLGHELVRDQAGDWCHDPDVLALEATNAVYTARLELAQAAYAAVLAERDALKAEVERLRPLVPKLEAEVERLHYLVEPAYREGYSDGNVEERYRDGDADWNYSNAKKALEGGTPQ
jgi:hypothetical protein